MTFQEMVRDRLAKAGHKSREKELLKVVVSDMQRATLDGKPSESQCVNIVKSTLKGVNEVLDKLPEGDGRRPQYEEERAILLTLLPIYMSLDEVLAKLREDGLVDAIKASPKDGQAVGIAVGHLKKAKAPVEGDTVSRAVALIRS